MEPSATSLHIKTTDRVGVLDAIRAALAAEGLRWVGGGPDAPDSAKRMLLMPAARGWVSLYPEESALASELAPAIALQLGAPTLTVGTFDEAAFFYLAHGPKGDLADAFHSCPDYAKDVDEPDASDDELARTRGDAAKLTATLGAGDAEALGRVLSGARIERLAEHDAYSGPTDVLAPLAALAQSFGLPDLTLGFDDLWGIDDDEEDLDLRYLAYAPPKEPGRLRSLLDRARARWSGRGAAPASAAESAEAGDADADPAADEPAEDV